MDIEQSVAARVQSLMEDRGWSQSRLSKALTDAGYVMHQSAISKIVNPKEGEARRKISVSELVGFAEIFGVTPNELIGEAIAPRVKERRERLAELVEEMSTLV